jgi:hypothetical protein
MAWFTMLGLYAISLLANILLSVVMGAMRGWMVSCFFLGRWVAKGLNVIGIDRMRRDLYTAGEALGFLIGFTKG